VTATYVAYFERHWWTIIKDEGCKVIERTDLRRILDVDC
jgi:hypothetical protein